MQNRAALPEPFRSAPAHALRESHLARGGTLFRKNGTSRGLYFLASGLIELRRYTPEGDRVVLHQARSGQTFAEASLFSRTYHCDAVAVLDCDYLEMDRTYFLDALKSDPAFAVAVTTRFAHQIQAYRRKLEILAIRNADDRVFTAFTDGLMASDIKTFAAEIGLAHEVVYRSLSNLVSKGKLIKTGRGRYQGNASG